jgi:phage repressor protein C with HTH and peptisase S24 domain
MEPVLLAGDVVVLKVGALVRAGSLVVARADDDGYVIKRVARITPTTFELESFNPAYEPFGIPRDARRIVGVVACILRTDDRMM